MTKKLFFFGSILVFSSGCQKQYSGYCISGSSPSDYQVLEFVEHASTQNRAEKKVEKILNQKFPTNGDWSCDVK